METRLRRLTMLLLEKQRQFGSLFRTAQSPTTPANGAANQQQHQHQPPQQQPQQLQQDDEIAKQGREVYAALAKAAQDSPPAQQPQEEQQQQHSTGAERPPTPPLQPGLVRRPFCTAVQFVKAAYFLLRGFRPCCRKGHCLEGHLLSAESLRVCVGTYAIIFVHLAHQH